jgi:NACHT domain
MYLDHTQQGKIDPLLQDALERAEGDDVLRVVMVLGAEEEENGFALSTQPLDPEQFTTRQDYRQALITQRQQSLSEILGTTLESLRNLSMKTYGGITSRLVVAEGTAQQLIRALTLEGVRSVTLDQVIRVGETPPPDEDVEAFLAIFAEVLPDLHTNQRLRQSVAKAISFYIQTYYQLHGRLKILGMREPVLLESIYTSVQFLEKADLWRFESIEDIEKAFRGSQKRGFQPKDCQKQDGLVVANAQTFLMVLGGPGSGKSTFLRRIGLEVLKGNTAQYQHSLFPIFIELKQFAAEVDLAKVIVKQLQNCQFPDPNILAKKLLEKGKLLILLDGFDEVPTQQLDRATYSIQEFIKKYRTNRFIGSCRTAAYRSYFKPAIPHSERGYVISGDQPFLRSLDLNEKSRVSASENFEFVVPDFKQFTEVFMADFGSDQIRHFIQNWFQAPDDLRLNTAKKFWNLLEQPDYAAVRELAQTPLLLTLLCLVFDDAQYLPKNRATLYREALDILLKTWAAEKRIQRDPIYRKFSIALEEMMLSQLAYQTFVIDRLFFSRQEAAEKISIFLAKNLNTPQNLDALAVLNAIEIQQGILVERGQDVLSFSHLTFQEFLTAKYIIDEGILEKHLQQHLTNSRWREVFLLTAGLSHNADFLLREMTKKAESYIATPRLKSLLSWADREASSSSHPDKSTAKKTLAIALSIDLCLDLDRDLDLTFELVRTRLLARANVYALVHVLDRYLAHTFASDRALANGLDLAHNLTKNKVFKDVNSLDLIEQLKLLELQFPLKNQSFASRCEFMEDLRLTWCKAVHLDPEWVKLSHDELVALSHYFYACELIVRCKEAAIFISPSVWLAIVESLVRVEPEELSPKPVQHQSILARFNPFRYSSQSEKV